MYEKYFHLCGWIFQLMKRVSYSNVGFVFIGIRGRGIILILLSANIKIFPPVRLDFSANIPCLFGKGIIMPFGKVTCS